MIGISAGSLASAAMVAEVGRSKAVAVALRQVSVVDGSGAAVDLTEFIGSDEDETDAVAQAQAVVDTAKKAATDDLQVEVGGSAVADFLGGPPQEVPGHYAAADPARLAPGHAEEDRAQGVAPGVAAP